MGTALGGGHGLRGAGDLVRLGQGIKLASRAMFYRTAFICS